MPKRTRLLLVSFVAVLAVTFLSPVASHAQVGISMFPIKFDLTVSPGQTYSDTVTVINPNNFPIGVQPEVENISGGNQGSIDLVATNIPHGLSSWISINQTSFTLAPQQQKQIPFSITVPANGEPGGHYGAILFRGLSVVTSTSGVGLSGRVGSVVLVNVPGASFATGKIDSFTMGSSSYASHGPFSFSFTVENNGNTHFSPTGQVTLSGPLFPTTVIPFNSGIIFPGFNRVFSASWPGRYAFGPITATLSLNIPDSGTQTAVISFFAFPWQEAVGLLILIILVVLFFGTFAKNFKIVRVKK